MTGLDRDSIEMREVSPFSGLLPNQDRLQILSEVRRVADLPALGEPRAKLVMADRSHDDREAR